MAVFRVHKNTDYTVMANHHLRDKGLSLSAKGLLSVILSLPPDWNYSIRGLSSICKEGDKAVKTALDELKEHGYVVVTRVNPSKGNNRVTYRYDIFESPKSGETEKPQVSQAYPSEGVQGEGVQREALPDGIQLSTEELSTEELSTEELNTEDTSNVSSQKSGGTAEAIKSIIDYFNETMGTRYTYRNKTVNGYINARLSEGFTVQDFKTVIDNKVSSWKGTKWEQFIRPNTLFAPSHFEAYLNERRKERTSHDFSDYDRAFYGG